MTLVHLALNLYSENKTKTKNKQQCPRISELFLISWVAFATVQTSTSPRCHWLPQVSPVSCWDSSQLLPTAMHYDATAKIFFSILPFISSQLHQLFPQTILLPFIPQIKLFLCSVAFSQTGLLNLPDLFHAIPQLEGHPAFSLINQSSPPQNTTPVLIFLNLKGWDFSFLFLN